MPVSTSSSSGTLRFTVGNRSGWRWYPRGRAVPSTHGSSREDGGPMRLRRHSVPYVIAALTLLVFASAAPASAADPKVPMIVVLAKDADVDAAVERGKRKHGIRPDNTFRHAARGYAAKLTKAQARAIEREAGVDAVVPDAVVELAAQSTPAGVRRVGTTRSPLTHIDTNDL